MSNDYVPPGQYGLNLATGFMILVGWGGLFFLIQNVIPTAGPRWLFFVLFYIAATGTSMPFIRFLNVQFISPYVSDTVVLREGLWVGLYLTTCAWLQIPRVFNWTIALILALGIIIIEGFLRLREDYELEE